MAKKGYLAERQRILQLEERGFHCTRNSGSIGASDIVAIKNVQYIGNSIGFMVRYEQVKNTREKTFYFNKRSKDELRRLKEINERFGIPCYFAIKFNYKGWLVLNVDEINGKPIKWRNE